MRSWNLVQQVKEVSRPEWFAASALSVAMFSVGFSVSVAACSVRKAEPPGVEPAASANRTAERVVPAAPAVASAVVVSPASSLAVTATPAPKASARPAPLAASPLAVKRFLIASAIESREPVLAESVSVSTRPVFAFAELENAGDYEQRVRVTFELEGRADEAGKRVGHVELAVPASSARFRTWAKTRLIDKPGEWAAVLRDEQGNELARTPFQVTL